MSDYCVVTAVGNNSQSECYRQHCCESTQVPVNVKAHRPISHVMLFSCELLFLCERRFLLWLQWLCSHHGRTVHSWSERWTAA